MSELTTQEKNSVYEICDLLLQTQSYGLQKRICDSLPLNPESSFDYLVFLQRLKISVGSGNKALVKVVKEILTEINTVYRKPKPYNIGLPPLDEEPPF